MKIQLLPYEYDSRDSHGNKWGTGRSPGLHLQDIIRFRWVKESRQAKIPVQDQEDWDSNIYIDLGATWEERQVRNKPYYMAQGEMTRDGVIMTPDTLDARDGSVVEFKLTTKSYSWFTDPKKNPFIEFKRWWWQIMSYCRAYGSRRAKLIVCFFNGDYKPPKPKVVCFGLEFSQEELDDNWRVLMQYARLMEEEKKR